MTKKTLITLALLAAGLAAGAQDTLRLVNPSFEDEFPSSGRAPEGWLDRGSPGESPPDIQPGEFNVFWPAEHGQTYVSMVVRDNSTWEGLGQKLPGWLKKGSVYTFNVSLARSSHFYSRSRTSNDPVPFGMSCVLQVWGANTATGHRELLAVTQPIAHHQWQRYAFELAPVESDYDELQLMAYFKENVFKAYNGNLLMDNCSEIVKK